jgi:2,4-dienoyl-CoA reductase [(3E)-enoyl-CoA-producing], peroxisomal
VLNFPSPYFSTLLAAKAGVDSLTDSLAGEWSEFGIRVNSLAPGPIKDTVGFDRLVKDLVDEADIAPLGRAG